MLGLYKSAMTASAPLLRALLQNRLKKGKEDPARLSERRGEATLSRPEAPLIWLHAASVGEAQSALILIDALHAHYPDSAILVTTGTVSSATLMKSRLPPCALHQFYPLDHPHWVARFLDHWQPDLVLWMESEIWPNMLREIKDRAIPAVLINARLSRKSFRRWRFAGRDIKTLLESFTLIMTQTVEDSALFKALGADNVIVTDNLKYSAKKLPSDDRQLHDLQAACLNRPLWLYASTHAREEELACRLHSELKKDLPDLLTIIVPRHPERREAIVDTIRKSGLAFRLRTAAHALPQREDDIYVADTLGELGLFYRLCPLACIGRSFSADGGGGHNPIEAAQLDCAVLHGPHVQNLAQIYADMHRHQAALPLRDEADFLHHLRRLLTTPDALETQRRQAMAFIDSKAAVLENVMAALKPLLTTVHRQPEP